MASHLAEVRQRLQQAIGTGELVRIVYYGGSRPGTFRDVAPIEITGEHVLAFCETTNSQKTFRLDKIDLRAAGPVDNRAAQTLTSRSAPLFETVAEIHSCYRHALEAVGWHVEFLEVETGAFLHLYERFKNGKLRKSPTITLNYQHTTYDVAVTQDGDFEHINVRPRVRPWGVVGKDGNSNWANVAKAVDAFLVKAGITP